jgi:hypothetical protein
MAAWVLGTTAVGSLRAASTLIGPINMLLTFTALGLTPMLVRLPRDRDFGFCAKTGIGLSITVLAWGMVLLSLPASVGQALLGESWDGARLLLPWTLLEYVGVSIAAGAALGLKVRSQAREIRVQKSLVAGATLVGVGLVLYLQTTVTAVAAALALAGLLSAVLAWAGLARGRRRIEGMTW